MPHGQPLRLWIVRHGATRIDIAERFGTVTKGGRTQVVSPDGHAWCCELGHVGLAISGSGDTLAGLVAGLLARGAEPAAAGSVFRRARSRRRCLPSSPRR